jgi:Domain of unknown function (DUF5060)/Putative collagen-binding domain of a collagenase
MHRLIALALLCTSPASAATVVSKIVLVDANTGKDLMEVKEGTVINPKLYGGELTLRADVAGQGCVSMVLDSAVERAINSPPYYLAGTSREGAIFPASSLQQVGQHTLILRPCQGGKPIKVKRGSGRPEGANGDEVKKLYDAAGIDNILRSNSGPGGVLAIEPGGVVVGVKPSGWSSIHALFTGAGRGGRKLEEEAHAIAHRRDLAYRLEGDTAINFCVSDNGTCPANAKLLPSSQVPAYDHDVFGAVSGELKLWHKVTLGFEGPPASEFGMTQPSSYEKASTFPDYRCDIILSHTTSSKSYTVPCYYAGNGDAANGAIENGNVWLGHHRPDETGVWNWTVEFKKGTNVAQNGGGDTAGFFDGVTGSFDIDPSDKTGRDLRSKGRLQYVGEHYLKFAGTGEVFVKAGPDSPSNFLAYEEFDATAKGKDYDVHKADYVPGQFTWNGNQGHGIIGALNYLASAGMNVLTVNLISDDGKVSPWSGKATERKTDFDISKLAQWEVVFDHAEKIGITLHLKFQETDDGTTFKESALEEHNMSEQRKIFYREMIARFGHHLGITWNLGKDQLHPEYLNYRSAYIRKVDPYNSPILVQATDSAAMDSGLLGLNSIEGVSLHSSNDLAQAETLKWISRSASEGRKWIVSVDQQADVNEGVKPDSNSNMDVIREKVLYGNLMAGGAGVQYFFGLSFSDSDLDAETFKSRSRVWAQSKIALDFFKTLPLINMSSQNGWLIDNGTDSVLASNDFKTIVYYKTSTSSTQIMDFPNPGVRYALTWYNPQTGVKSTRASAVKSGAGVTLPKPPSQQTSDWVALMTCTSC